MKTTGQDLRKTMRCEAKMSEPPQCTRQNMRMASEFSTKQTAFFVSPTGIALLSTLLILLMVTILIISMIQVSHIQEKMSASIQDKDLAFHAAESALLGAETWLLTQNSEPPTLNTCHAYPCLASSDLNADFTQKNSTWWKENSVSSDLILANVSSPPRYLIEFIGFVPDTPILGNAINPSDGVYYYRITARGTGPSGHVISILQSTVARRY